MPSPEARHRRPTVPLTGAPGSPGLRDPSAEARAPGTGARMTGERRTGVPGRGGPGYEGSGAGDRGANAGAEGTGERRVGYTGTGAMMPGRRVRGTGGSVSGKRGAITAAGRFSTGNPSFSTPIFFFFVRFQRHHFEISGKIGMNPIQTDSRRKPRLQPASIPSTSNAIKVNTELNYIKPNYCDTPASIKPQTTDASFQSADPSPPPPPSTASHLNSID